MTFSTEQLKALDPKRISEASQKHIESVIAELVETALPAVNATQHPNADLLRALADGKQVWVQFTDDGFEYRVQDCSATVVMSLIDPASTPQDHYWEFRIEQQTKEDSHE